MHISSDSSIPFAYHFNIDNTLLPVVDYLESGSMAMFIQDPSVPKFVIDAHMERLHAHLAKTGAVYTAQTFPVKNWADVLALAPYIREQRTAAYEHGRLALVVIEAHIPMTEMLEREADASFYIRYAPGGPVIALGRLNRVGEFDRTAVTSLVD